MIDKPKMFMGGYKKAEIIFKESIHAKCIELKSSYFADSIFIFPSSSNIIVHDPNSSKWKTIKKAGEPADLNNPHIKKLLNK